LRLGQVPFPLPGDAEHLLLWAQVRTGMEMTDQGELRTLDARTWQERRQRLQELGGAPLP
jgi:hypothetical protein